MQANAINNKKVYDDFESMLNNKKRNNLLLVLKITLISFLVIFSALILFFAPLTLFSNKLVDGKSISWFLDFSNPAFEKINYIVLFRIFLLLGIFLYTFIANFSNLINQREATKKYIVWFVIYLLFSLASLVLLFTFFKKNIVDYYYLSLISIPLLLVDIAYLIYKFQLKSKTDPVNYKNKVSMIISIVSRITFVFLFIGILSAWVFSKTPLERNDFLNNNKVHNFFVELFNQRSIKNLFLMILFISLLVLLVFLINIENIILLISKQGKMSVVKEKILLYIFLFFTIFVWFIRTLFYKNEIELFKSNKNPKDYLYLIGIFFILLILVAYLLISFVKKLKIKGLLFNNLIFSFSIFLIWVIVSSISFLTKNKLSLNITLLIAAFASFIILITYRLKVAALSYYVSILLEAIIIMLSLSLLISGLNSILVANHNESFYLINSNLSLEQIFIIATTSIILIFILATVINLIVSLSKITKKTNMQYLERN
ncbi:Hypothetical protein, predicted transmembrane protein [Metamycoplasma auris 15026]|uniref:Transmembrane protein n=1 Tax=Metamycoplasma auris 15026 TaxID=1188233 RepID=N9TRQ9_9BACT|nr:hypothetical protein [Metamycoplasma auris]ENY68745.1 Hypothetical protein, predicted transmembrane protein [Metamycoplasma auris 15026]